MTFEVHVSALAGDRLAADVLRLRPTHVLSLLNPEREAPALGPSAERVVLRFGDHLAPGQPDGFDDGHARAILDLVDRLVARSRAEPVRLLVHCHMGQSRSPAVAYAALAVALGPGREQEAFDVVRRRCLHPWPNALIIETFDRALGRDGSLLQPLLDFQARWRRPGAAPVVQRDELTSAVDELGCSSRETNGQLLLVDATNGGSPSRASQRASGLAATSGPTRLSIGVRSPRAARRRARHCECDPVVRRVCLSTGQARASVEGHVAEYFECAFILPLLRNSDRQPHAPRFWRELEDVVNSTFVEGSSGPEQLFQIAPTPGRYTDQHGRTVHDESWRYFIALPEERIDELRALLRRACNTFDQEAIYLSVAGRVELVVGRSEDGDLGGVA